MEVDEWEGANIAGKSVGRSEVMLGCVHSGPGGTGPATPEDRETLSTSAVNPDGGYNE